MRGIFLFICVVFGVSCLSPHAIAQSPYIKFIENKGQWPEGAYFAADLPGGKLFTRKNQLTYSFYDREKVHAMHGGHGLHDGFVGDFNREEHTDVDDGEMLRGHFFNVNFRNANEDVFIQPTKQLPTLYNYFIGNNPKAWATAVSAYERVSYSSIYPSIDLQIYSQGDLLKYDLIVGVGGDPQAIVMDYEGADDLFLEENELHIVTSLNEIVEQEPYAYQVIDGQKKRVPCRFKLDGYQVGFEFPMGYDTSYELVIDPVLIFSTYSGSPADNWGNTATFDDTGKLYSGGITNHFRGGNFLGEFPATAGAYQTTWGGIWDVAILKYDSAGANVEYATYLGGAGSETPHSLIVNSQDELILFGTTSSTNFPTTVDAYRTSFQGGTNVTPLGGVPFTNGSDIFIAKLNSEGSQLTGSTFLGGAQNDGLNPLNGNLTRNYGDQQRGEVFIDDADNIYISGSTSSPNMFTDMAVTSFERDYQGGITDGLLVKMSPDLTSMLWGGYLGGTTADAAFAVKIGLDNSVYAAGGTDSPDFPVGTGGHIETYQGSIDGWVCQVAEDGASILNSTFLGTGAYDQAYFMDVDSRGDIYILGQTQGSYPVSPGVYNNPNSGHFIHKLNATLDASIFSTVFGVAGRQTPNISLTAFLVNDCNNLYVSGWGSTNGAFTGFNYVNLDTRNLPTTFDAIRQTSQGSDFYLMVLDADATSLLYGTFFGGEQSIVHVDGGTSRFDKRGIVYHAVCASCFESTSTFPTTPGAWSQVNGAGGGCNNAAFKFDLASLRALIQTNSVELDNPGVTRVCIPDDIVFENFSIGGEIFEWDFGDGTSLTKLDSTQVTHNYPVPGSYLVTLRAIDPNTCIGEDVATVTITVSEVNSSVVDDGLICAGDPFQLFAVGGVQYEWVSEDGAFTSGLSNPIVMPEDTTRYFVTITDSNSCVGMDTVNVDVIPSPELDFDVFKLHDCFSRPPIRLVNRSEEGEEFLWRFGDGNTSTEEEVVHSYETDGTYTITLEGTREFCTFQKQVDLDVVTLKVPNVFTPSAEEHNDTFEIISGSQVHLRVYNRWGNLVFENQDYQNEWSGEGEPAGVYYYEADITDETTCRGWVQVIK